MGAFSYQPEFNYDAVSPSDSAECTKHLLPFKGGFLKGLDWWMFPNAVSPFWRLYYNAIPGHHVVFGNQRIPLAPDQLMLIPDGNTFDTHGLQPVDHFWITFSLGYAVNRRGAILLPADPATVSQIASIAGSFDGVGTGDRFAIYHACHTLLHRLIVGIRDQFQPGDRSVALARAVDHMRRNIAEPLQIGAVAAIAGVSQRALSDQFQKEYHCSPGQYLTKLRIGEAATLLSSTDHDVDHIAETAGFSDRFYLSRVFKKMTGKSPVQYRKAHTRDNAVIG